MEEKQIEGRKWQITINNPVPKGFTHEVIKGKLKKWKSLTYYCMSDEVARTHHTHVYMVFSSPIRFSSIKNQFGEAHIEKAYGKSEENRNYIFKEGEKWEKDKKKETNLVDTHEEWGEMPLERQGARSDLAELFELIQEGKSNYEILEEKPELITQIERMDKVRQTIQEEAYKNVFRCLDVTYIWGDTSSGKTRYVMEKYGYEKVHRVTNYKNGFDLYKGQDVICFDEFQGQFPITQMLVYLDGYPCVLPSRFYDRIACYTKVYILSNVDLTSQYKEVQASNMKTWEAFLRRINHVHVYKDDKVEIYTLAEYLDAFHKMTPEELKCCPFEK